MAKIQRNQKLIAGNYDRLSEEEKRNKIKLNDSYYIAYPLALEQNKFQLKQELMTKNKEEQKTLAQNARTELKKPLVANDFAESNKNRNTLFENASALLQKDKRFLLKDSPEMLWVKKSLAGLTNVLDEGLVAQGYLGQNNRLDSQKLVSRVNAAYDAFFEAAQNYIDSRKSTSKTATRRRNKIIELLNQARQAKADFNTMVEASKDKLIDFENLSENQKNGLTARNLVNSATAKEAVLDTIKWQNEGNSTDVYRMKLKGEDGFYYLKENLPFIDEDLPGYLDRRIAQLEKSSSYITLKNSSNMVEERLVTADVNELDIAEGVKFLQNLKTRINNEPDATRYAEMDRLSVCLAKNFDRVFDEFHKYNDSVDIMKKYPEKSLDEMIESAPDALTKQVLEFRKEYLIKNKMYVPGQVVKNEKKTAADYVIAEMGLDPTKDEAVITQLRGMKDEAVEKLFRYTLGKEMELYGQMKEKASKNGVREKDESIMAAMNNTATSRLAERYGFGDVITKSKTALVKYQRRDGTMVNKLCTVSEEAPGMEYIDVMKKAQKEGLKIVYSPEAMRNLMRLQANDTLTLQIDRHGRNFKCDWEIAGKNLIIKTVKAYDNDMSFGNQKLADVFQENAQGETPKYQFLPSMKTKAKPGTAMYKFIMKHYLGVDTNLVKMNDQFVLNTGRFRFVVNNDNIRSVMRNGAQFNTDMSFNEFTMGKIKLKLTGEERAKFIKDNIKIGKWDTEETAIHDYGKAKYLEIINKINKIWVRDPKEFKDKNNPRKGFNRYLKSDIEKDNLQEQDLKDLDNAIAELRDLYSKFDYSQLTNTIGAFSTPHLYMQMILGVYERSLGNSIEHKIRSQAKDPQAVFDLMDESGNIEVPTMLHYDKDAYDQLQKSVIDLGNPESNAVLELKELGFSQDKIDALKARNQEQLDQIEWAKNKAQLFYKACGWEGKKPQGEFLLKKGDYKEFDNLLELSVDPGNTYLAVENDKYLCSLPEYRELMTEKEIKEAENYIKAQNEDIKRWKYKPDEVQKEYNKSALSSNSMMSLSGEAYLQTCINDEEYSRTNEPLTKEQKLQSVIKTAFLKNLKADINEKYKGLKVKTSDVKKMLDPNSKESQRLSLTQDDLQSVMGSVLNKYLEKQVETKNPCTTKEALECVEQAGKAFQTKTVDSILKIIQNKPEMREQYVKGMTNLFQRAEDMIGKTGCKPDLKGELEKIVKADPKKYSAETVKTVLDKINEVHKPKNAEKGQQKQADKPAKLPG